MTRHEARVFGTPPEADDAVTTVHLLTMVGYTAADIAAASRPLVFEQLLWLSYGDVCRYRSDYFHDARWLAEHLNTVPFWFVYRWSEHGTWITGCRGRFEPRRSRGRNANGAGHPSRRQPPRAPRC